MQWQAIVYIYILRERGGKREREFLVYPSCSLGIGVCYFPIVKLHCLLSVRINFWKCFSFWIGDPVGPHRKMPQRDSRRDIALWNGVPLLPVWCGQSRGGIQASDGGSGKGMLTWSQWSKDVLNVHRKMSFWVVSASLWSLFSSRFPSWYWAQSCVSLPFGI